MSGLRKKLKNFGKIPAQGHKWSALRPTDSRDLNGLQPKKRPIAQNALVKRFQPPYKCIVIVAVRLLHFIVFPVRRFAEPSKLRASVCRSMLTSGRKALAILA